MGDNESKPIYGSDWTSKLYYYNNSDDPDAYRDNQLTTDLVSRIPDDEYVVDIQLLKCKLYDHQPFTLGRPFGIVHHEFVMVKSSKDNFYSLEKNTTGIHLQKSKHFNNVVYYLGRMKRIDTVSSNTTCFRKLTKVPKIQDLIKWIYTSDQLNKTYHWTSSNCQNFADTLFFEYCEDEAMTAFADNILSDHW